MPMSSVICSPVAVTSVKLKLREKNPALAAQIDAENVDFDYLVEAIVEGVVEEVLSHIATFAVPVVGGSSGTIS